MGQTRGMVRHETKLDRRRKRLPQRALIVGLDIGKRRHAVWMIDPESKPLARAKIEATPSGISDMLQRAERVRAKAELNETVVALEPTSHLRMLIANDLEQRGV